MSPLEGERSFSDTHRVEREFTGRFFKSSKNFEVNGGSLPSIRTPENETPLSHLLLTRLNDALENNRELKG